MRVNLSQLTNQLDTFKSGELYCVDRANDQNCIYSLFKIEESQNLYLQFDRYYSIWRIYNNTSYYSKDATHIELIIDNPDNTTVRLSAPQSYHESYVHIVGENYKVKIEVSYYNINKLLNFKLDVNDDEVKLSCGKIRCEVDLYKTKFDNEADAFRYYAFNHPGLNALENNAVGQAIFNLQTIYPIKSSVDERKTSGISKLLKTILPLYNAKDRTNTEKLAFRALAEGTKFSVDGIKISVIFNRLFENVTSQHDFESRLKELTAQFVKSSPTYYESYCYKYYVKKLLDNQPDAKELKKAAIKKKATGAFTKKLNDLDFVDVDAEKYPLTHKAVYEGEIPLGTFFRKEGETYFIYNDNWALWEPLLEKYPETIKAIAADASKRTTYEKDLMSYFYFIQYALPEYLERHTGKKWTCEPKLVKSSSELEPPKEGSNGVAKTRSALTPIVDNKNCHVIVPYVSMIISGYTSQSCYALDYNVLQRGMSYKGSVVTSELEERLNGVDDYGLMFYTLTGTSSATGYPTFLIIFERLNNDVRVHFHRTHPMRSKDGDYSPIHNWIKGCYKWMIGNVPFGAIKVQQGDLAFVKIEDKLDFSNAEMVNAYDSHAFTNPVAYLPYEKKDKQNVLGYFHITADEHLTHPEHKDRVIPAGTYELRQCRSWEANPVGIWSLRID